MSIANVLFPTGKYEANLHVNNIFSKYPNVVSDYKIHSGWPHIKGTRILASDIFRAVAKGSTYNDLIMDFKQMDISVSKGALEEAVRFTIDLLHYFNEKKTSGTER